MTRESAVRHPPRACFLKVHAWVVKKFDHATAAVFAAVEYRDRLNDADELWFRCTNDDLVQIIGGLFKKDKVAKGLNALVAAGWVEKDMKTEKDGQLYRTIISLRLMSSKINLWIEENLMKSEGSDLSTPGGAKNRPPGSEKSPARERKIGDKNKEVVFNENNNKEETFVVCFADGSEHEGIPAGLEDAIKFMVSKAKRIDKDMAAYAAGILSKTSPEKLLAAWDREQERQKKIRLNKADAAAKAAEEAKAKAEADALAASTAAAKVKELLQDAAAGKAVYARAVRVAMNSKRISAGMAK